MEMEMEMRNEMRNEKFRKWKWKWKWKCEMAWNMKWECERKSARPTTPAKAWPSLLAPHSGHCPVLMWFSLSDIDVDIRCFFMWFYCTVALCLLFVDLGIDINWHWHCTCFEFRLRLHLRIKKTLALTKPQSFEGRFIGKLALLNDFIVLYPRYVCFCLLFPFINCHSLLSWNSQLVVATLINISKQIVWWCRLQIMVKIRSLQLCSKSFSHITASNW